MSKRIKRIGTNLIEILNRPDMAILPGQLAFFFILSLVPTLTIVVYIASFMSISMADIMGYLNIGISESILEMLTPYVENTEFNLSMVILLAMGIYIASNGTNSIIVTANNIYGIEQTNYIERRIKAIFMVFIIILLFIFIVIVPIFGNFLLSLVERITGYNGFLNFLSLLKWPFSFLVIFFFIKILYTIAPDKQMHSSYVNVGSLFTSVGWVIATEGYLYYAGHFGNYNLYYSGLSNLAVLMMWIYILTTIFVIGMGINFKEEPYEIERTQKLEEIRAAKKNQHKEK